MRRRNFFVSICLVIITQLGTYDVYHLATARLGRYLLLNFEPEDDLEQSILGFAEAILSLPLPRDSPLPFPTLVEKLPYDVNKTLICLITEGNDFLQFLLQKN